MGQRIFNLVLGLLIAAVLAMPIALIAFIILVVEGRPVLFVSERMAEPLRGFQLYKFRTMHVAANEAGVSGGDKQSRITKTGAFLRRYRLDELPQIWNVLRGDINLVGPRPPLREYVEAYPKIYAQVLKSKPGITGLASLHFHKHEEWLLSSCTTPEETDDVYRRRCIKRKARIDLIYQNNHSLCFDLNLMAKTLLRRP